MADQVNQNRENQTSAENSVDRIVKKADWKHLYTGSALKKAGDAVRRHQVSVRRTYSGRMIIGEVADESGAVHTCRLSGIPVQMGDTFEEMTIACTRNFDVLGVFRGRNRRYTDCDGDHCWHSAAVLLAAEEEFGPFTVKESDEDYQKRLTKIRFEREIARRRALQEQTGTDLIPVSSVLKIPDADSELSYFDFAGIFRDYRTTPYAAARMKEFRDEKTSPQVRIKITPAAEGKREISAACAMEDLCTKSTWIFLVDGDGVPSMHASIQRPDPMYDDKATNFIRTPTVVLPADRPVNEYQLYLFQKVMEEAAAYAQLDLTDERVWGFFNEISRESEDAARADAKESAGPAETLQKKPIFVIRPRIIVDEEGDAALSFKAGTAGGRMFVLRDIGRFTRAYSQGQPFELTKKATMDFSAGDLTPESAKLMQFLTLRVGDIAETNERIEARSYFYRTPTLSVNSQEPLAGSYLDRFYEAAEGMRCDLEFKQDSSRNTEIRVEHRPLRFPVQVDPVQDVRGHLVGIAVSGRIPVLIYGQNGGYLLGNSSLSRLDSGEAKALKPFHGLADQNGDFHFEIGAKNLQEFYYRVIPVLMDSPYVRFTDNAGELAEKILPPEPEFVFRLDLEEDKLTCACEVSYPGRKYRITPHSGQDKPSGPADGAAAGESAGKSADGYRDQLQEKRVAKVLSRYFDQYSTRTHVYLRTVDDDLLFGFLHTGIADLERFGTVTGTDAFRRRRLIRMSSVTVGVSVESGLMDLSVTSPQLSEEELLEVFHSYTLRKRYHRLRNGSYVDFSGNSDLAELQKLLSDLELAPDDVIRGKAHLPLYRAVYLDRMLEKHVELATTRDRVYRRLIRNFASARDEDVEVPSCLTQTLRPYQAAGFRWLKMLQNVGFGGILADEMGLGKTLQMIALFQYEKEQGVRLPSLVVSPASLVYNWKEEISRFAPDLVCETVTGTKSERKAILEQARTGIPQKETAPETLPAAETEQSAASETLPAVETEQSAASETLPAVETEQPAASGALPAAAAQQPAAAGTAQPAGYGAARTADVYVVSYDLLKRDVALYEGIRFHIAVLDEAQYIKNQKAGVTKAVKALSAESRFALTGTPIENRLSELWSIFDYLMPGLLYSSTEFESRYERPITKNQDSEASDRLKKLTGPFILRRRKADVLRDLPDKLEEVRYVKLSGEQQKLYDAQVAHMKGMLSEPESGGTSAKDRIRVLAELTRLREICCDPSLVYENYHGESAKREACLELIQSAIDGGHRILVFSQFTSMLALLEQDLTREQISYDLITGATPKEKRMQLVHDFNAGDVPVFLISLRAGGTGLNLTGADVVIHYDPWWNLSAQNQATDRAHRIGQTRNVTVYKMIMKNSVEEKILDLQNAKKDLADAILEGDSTSLASLSAEELMELLD